MTFLAFFKPFLVESCINKDCFTELSEVLIVLMVVPIFIYCVEDAVIKKVISDCFFSFSVMTQFSVDPSKAKLCSRNR